MRYSAVYTSSESETAMDAMPAPRELPAEMIIRSPIELSDESFDAVLERLENPRQPTQALLDLLSGDPIDEDR